MHNRPALLLAVAFALGILAAEWVRPHPVLCAAILVPLAALAAGRRGGALLLAAIALAGAARWSYVQTAGRGNLDAWTDRRVTLVGTVVSEPALQADGRVTYIVAAEAAQGQPARGRVRVAQRGGTAPAYGERVAATGVLTPPAPARRPGGFDEAAYLARQSVYLVMESGPVERMGPGRVDWFRRVAVATRLRLEAVLQQALPEREAALMAGLLFGSRGHLPEDVADAFRGAGVFHLLAVSGGNVAMVVMPLLWLLYRAGLGRRAAAALAVPAVVFFIFLTGASPSVLRAGLMAVLVLAGDILGRERDALNTLGAAAALLLMGVPGLLFDLGFQLSVAATLGILLLAGPIRGWLEPRLARALPGKPPSWLSAGLAATLAAQALVEPLSLHAFGLFSPVGPLANLAVIPYVGLLVPFGLATVLLGLFAPPAVWLLGVAGRGALVGLVYMVKALASVPLAQVDVGRLPPGWALGWYAALAWAALPEARRIPAALWARLRACRRAVRAGGALAGALALLAAAGAALSWRLALAAPPDALELVVLDVGQGDAILVKAPGDHAALVDAGPAYEFGTGGGRFDAGAAVVVPHLRRIGVRRLDLFVLTHPDVDHVGGAGSVLRALPVGQVLVSTPRAEEVHHVSALETARALGVPVRVPQEGEVLRLGEEVFLEVLGPPSPPITGSRSDDNANCVALRVVYRQVAFLLACDLEAVAEERLVERGRLLRADVLKVSHHGSRFSTGDRFLEAVRPRYAVISAGAGNPFGHPHADVLDRLSRAGAEIWRTDRHGTVTVRTDGFQVRVEGSRGRPPGAPGRPLLPWSGRLIGVW
ncbi:DNA internalization-related competence protein ComEC/Rec2 [Symbiobacterium thermophilum]|uniref:DNA internalization-related competence protein ComEC/Rec2 n=1 Tax=Symbiobacterium thermophilum TaxID=2734 RepID=UPI0023540B73|nr:DNA internalization-related competence protein ComEC/Rec2 [Symbiobacterium thermophilum]